MRKDSLNMFPNFIGVTGLPRAGSTLLCQLLAQHPELDCESHSSPLCNTLLGIRRTISDDSFFLSQLDHSFASSYGHLQTAMRGYLRGWYHGSSKKGVVDKNRAWLHAIELLLDLAPEAKLVICLRELGQIYGSIEAQHQKTVLLDFADHLADFDRLGRADMLFAKDRTIGAPLQSINAVQDLPDEVKKRLYFMRFEDLISQPIACMAHLYQWLGVSEFKINPEEIAVGIQESDSHYRMKYLHKQSSKISMSLPHHIIPVRIQSHIENANRWYYELYYPGKIGV